MVPFVCMLLRGPVCWEALEFCEMLLFVVLLETSGVECLEIGEGLGVFESSEPLRFTGDLLKSLSDGGTNRTRQLSKPIGDLEVASDVLRKESDEESDDTTDDEENDDEDEPDEHDSFFSPLISTVTLLLSREMESLALGA